MTGSRTRAWLMAAACAVLFLQAPAETAFAQRVTAEQIESAFLFNFAKFTEWPESRFPSPTSPIFICVVGDKSFASTLQRVVAGEKISGRIPVVKSIDGDAELRDCHIGFVPSSSKLRVSQILNATGNAGVLTIGQTEEFAHQGGIVRLYIQEGRARFEINPAAAARSGLRISSSLLALATIVKDVPPEGGRQ